MKTSALAIDGGVPVREKPYSTARGLAVFGDEEIDAALEVLRARSMFRYYGPDLRRTVEAFESRLREMTGARYALGLSSGTAALDCGLVGLGVEEGDEVIVPAVTFIATVSSVVRARAVPVFAEVDDSLTIDPQSVKANTTDKTVAVIPVHLVNAAAEMGALPSDLKILEDAAQAAGVSYKGQQVGSIGDAGAFSLQLEKNITSGEGGALVTDDWDVYDRAARYQDQGGQFTTSKGETRDGRGGQIDPQSGEPFLGANLRMTEIAGAIAEVQLSKLPAMIETCRARAKAVRNALPDLHWRRIPDPDGDGGSLLFFVDDAPRFASALRAEGIPAGQLYGGRPVYMNPAVLERRTPWRTGCPFNCEKHPTRRTYFAGLCPRTEDLMRRNVIIGVGPRMTDADSEDVVTAVRKVAGALL